MLHEARPLRVPLAARPTPGAVLRSLRDNQRPFALVGAWFGASAVVGSDPVRVAVEGEDPLALLNALPEAAGPDAAFVGGGLVGYLGYELRGRIEPGWPAPPRPLPLPESALCLYDNVLRRDRAGRWWFEALVTPERERAIEERVETLRARLADPPPAREARTRGWSQTPGIAGHARAVAACVERIHAGDLYQANLTLRLEAGIDGDPLDLFAAANAALPTDRAAYLSGPWGALVSLSPELFLERRGRTVRSAPIKGTRPRPIGAAGDAARTELESSAKDRAENVMIVDLVRNDLGRVCEPGSIAVDALGEVRPHAGVWHMVSEVSGRLRDGVGDGELVRAAFPPGSVTGAPKIAAMGVIAELESTGREAYTGSIGMASPAAGLELSVAIRTLEASAGRAWLGVGGGIVADSDPAAEAQEALAKARPLLSVLGGRPPEAVTEAAAPPAPARRGPVASPRPDPALGVFETLLVEEGRPRRLEVHLRRLRASVRDLYGLDLPADLAGRAAAAALEGPDPGRMRILAVPAAGGLDTHVETSEAREGPQVLEPVVVPGGLGAHKWLDRRLAEAVSYTHLRAHET